MRISPSFSPQPVAQQKASGFIKGDTDLKADSSKIQGAGTQEHDGS